MKKFGWYTIGNSELDSTEELSKPTSSKNWGWCADWCGAGQTPAKTLKVFLNGRVLITYALIQFIVLHIFLNITIKRDVKVHCSNFIRVKTVTDNIFYCNIKEFRAFWLTSITFNLFCAMDRFLDGFLMVNFDMCYKNDILTFFRKLH